MASPNDKVQFSLADRLLKFVNDKKIVHYNIQYVNVSDFCSKFSQIIFIMASQNDYRYCCITKYKHVNIRSQRSYIFLNYNRRPFNIKL